MIEINERNIKIWSTIGPRATLGIASLELVKQFEKLGLSSVLLIDGQQLNESFTRAVRNIPKIDALPQQGANVYDILKKETLVLTRDAIQSLEARLK